MRVLTVVGARPQFIKAAVVSHELRKNHTEILVHTGQHYDYNMSEKFFEELDIPNPDYNLGISGGTHGQMTGKMLIAIEEVLIKETPDMLLVYGDTNSTLAAALAAAKLHIPVCHVEAGARTHNMQNPEEMNRICTDHLSSLLLVSTISGMDELNNEGLSDRAILVGDPMYDAFLEYSGRISTKELQLISIDNREIYKIPSNYCYMTCHREENTATDKNLSEIMMAVNDLDIPVIYPVHPRNKDRAVRIKNLKGLGNILLSEPIGYLESISLVNGAEFIVTDSGGLQREAFFAEKKCVTVLDFVVWPETMVTGRNVLAKPKKEDLLEKISQKQTINPEYHPFGDGKAAVHIVEEMKKFYEQVL